MRQQRAHTSAHAWSSLVQPCWRGHAPRRPSTKRQLSCSCPRPCRRPPPRPPAQPAARSASPAAVRRASPSPAAARRASPSPAPASSAGGPQYTPEQLAFLQRSGKVGLLAGRGSLWHRLAVTTTACKLPLQRGGGGDHGAHGWNACYRKQSVLEPTTHFPPLLLQSPSPKPPTSRPQSSKPVSAVYAKVGPRDGWSVDARSLQGRGGGGGDGCWALAAHWAQACTQAPRPAQSQAWSTVACQAVARARQLCARGHPQATSACVCCCADSCTAQTAPWYCRT